MRCQSSASKRSSKAKNTSSFKVSPAEQAARLEAYRKKWIGKPQQKRIDWTIIQKETPYTENSTIFPCNETVSVRVTPHPSDLYILDFIHPNEGTRFDHPGLRVYEVLGSSRKQLPSFEVWPGKPNPLELYLVCPMTAGKVKYEIRSASDDKVIGEVVFQLTVGYNAL